MKADHDAARRVAIKTVGLHREAYGTHGMGMVADGRGNLREDREDPAPTVGIAGRTLRGIPPTTIYPRRDTMRTYRQPIRACL